MSVVLLSQEIDSAKTWCGKEGGCLSGENQKGTGGRGRDRKCHKLSQIVVTFYDEFYDNL